MHLKDFEHSRPKENGRAPGFFAIHSLDQSEYLVKETPITYSYYYDARTKFKMQINPLSQDKIIRQFFQEYITAPLFQLLLPGRASSFELVYQANTTTILYGCSKLIPGYIDLYRQDLPSTIEGVEDVIAACLFAAEFDYHGDNIGTINNRLAAKIDHGMGATNFYTDESALRKDIHNKFSEFLYQKIPFNIEKFIIAINQMLCISDETIQEIINSRITNLENAGFVLANFSTYAVLNRKTSRHTFASASDLKAFYIEALIAQKYTMQSLIMSLTIFKDITPCFPIEFYNLIKEEPLEFAHLNSLSVSCTAVIEYSLVKRIPINLELITDTELKSKLKGKTPMKACVDGTIQLKSSIILLKEIVRGYELLKIEFSGCTANELEAFFRKVQAELYPNTIKIYNHTSIFPRCISTLNQCDIDKISSGYVFTTQLSFGLSSETFLSRYDIETICNIRIITGQFQSKIMTSTCVLSSLYQFSQYICQLLTPNNNLDKTVLAPALSELRELAQANIR